MPRVLIVDDSASIRREMRKHLESAGLHVCEASDGLEAIEQARVVKPDLVILDVVMPRLNGIETARELSRLHPDVRVVLHTLHADVVRAQGLPEGVWGVIAKGERLIPTVLTLLELA
jgi:two-component system, NtrC family, response regulator HydG